MSTLTARLSIISAMIKQWQNTKPSSDECQYLRHTALPMLCTEALKFAIDDMLFFGDLLTGDGINEGKTAGGDEIGEWIDAQGEKFGEIAFSIIRTAIDVERDDARLPAADTIRRMLRDEVIGAGTGLAAAL